MARSDVDRHRLGDADLSLQHSSLWLAEMKERPGEGLVLRSLAPDGIAHLEAQPHREEKGAAVGEYSPCPLFHPASPPDSDSQLGRLRVL